MNLAEWYEGLWSRCGGRPWTYIMRDIWHRYELIPQAVWFWAGVGVTFWCRGNILLITLAWLAYMWGYLNGHCFFGTPYVPDQQAPTTMELEDYESGD